MYNKVTGIESACSQVLKDTKTSRSAFKDYTSQLILKKGECKDIKAGYEKQKLQLKRDKAEADKFRFTNMKKRPDFLPTSLRQDNFH
jgi:hypothetical protein